MRTNILSLVIRLQKTSSRSFNQSECTGFGDTPSRCFQNVFKTFSRRLQEVFKTSCKNVFKASSKRLENVLKTSWRRLQDISKASWQSVFKTSLRRLGKISLRHIQHVFKTYHKVKLLLLTRLQDIFKMYSARFWDVLWRRLSTERFAKFALLRILWSG